MGKSVTLWIVLLFGLWSCAVDPVLLSGERIVIKGNPTVPNAPVIVLEAGAGDGPDKWQDLQDRLARSAIVVSYDRPRLGQVQTTGRDVAVHLRQQLLAKGLRPPYLLVGHSIGGPFVLSFAMQYPADVAGLVLIDGRPKGFAEACQQAGGSMCDIPAWLLPTLPGWVRSEIKGLPMTYQQHGDYKAMPNVPVLVLSADLPPPLSGDTFMQVWRRQQQLQAGWFAQGRYLLVKESDHYIHHSHPELVETEILTLWRHTLTRQKTE